MIPFVSSIGLKVFESINVKILSKESLFSYLMEFWTSYFIDNSGSPVGSIIEEVDLKTENLAA
tara:strand:- start:264 stop:452 length:189 start_codon:yes stop_codon:yes gene_type:complete